MGQGFQELMAELEPRYDVPQSRQSSEAVWCKTGNCEDNIIEQSIRSDHRQVDIAGNAYLCDSCSPLYFRLVVMSVLWCLCIKELKGSHTATHVAENISSMLDAFGISREAVAVTAEDALNYVNVIHNLGTCNIPCLDHTLNLAIHKGLEMKAVDNALSRLKLILGGLLPTPAS